MTWEGSRFSFALCALALCGCATGIIGDDPSQSEPGQGASTTAATGGQGGASTTAATGGQGGAGTNAGMTSSPVLAGTPSITYATARLTNTQYINTIHSLLPSLTFTDPAVPNENVVSGFTNASSGQTATSLLIEDYQSAADQIATAAKANFGAIVTCQPTATADEDTCAQSFITDFGKRAYRRPLASDESTRMMAFYKMIRMSNDFPTSVIAVLQLFLQAPSFLYRLEGGSASPNGDLVPLTSYEIASRLSYLLTNDMPDADLMAAADQDMLTDPTQIEAQTRRLLADPRSHAAVASFNYQWLKLVKLENLTKDATAFPSFTPAIGQALHDSTVQFVDHAFWDLGTLTALLTDSEAYVNDAIAPYFGLPAPGSSMLKLMSTDATQRSGILTQSGLLAGLSGPANDSPVQRGVLVLDSLLCNRPPPPPAGINPSPPDFDPSAPMTTRDRLTNVHQQGPCAACHTVIDGVGFAFENYDALGSWRTEDSGLPVDASAELIDTDVDGPFVGAVSLTQKLSQSRQVSQCMAYTWLRYGLGLDSTQINLPAAQSITDTFGAAGGSFTELLVAITKSDYFRSLKVSN